jgi:hypothetical protein
MRVCEISLSPRLALRYKIGTPFRSHRGGIPGPDPQLKIGSIELRNNLIVAPMAGVTDRPFRSLCKRWAREWRFPRWSRPIRCCGGSEKTIRRGNHDGRGRAQGDPDRRRRTRR